MNDRRPVMIIYNDGTSEQIEPVSIAFFENLSRAATRQAEAYKQQVMINPPEVEAVEEKSDG